MCKINIQFNKMDTAISVMREVAAWGRTKGYRVWPDAWLTAQELLTADVQQENFVLGQFTEKLHVPLFSNGPILIIGLTHLNLKLLICINFAFAENLLERA